MSLNDRVSFASAPLGGLYIAVDLDENPLTYRTDPEVAAAILAILGIEEGSLSPTYDPFEIDELARERLRTLRRRPDGDVQGTVFLCYFSALVHELRHFHDLLSCTIGQDTLFRSVGRCLNVNVLLQVASAVCKSGESCPLPIGAPQGLGPMVAENPGLMDGLSQIIERQHGLDQDMKEFWKPKRPTVTGVTPATLFELSAVCAQAKAVLEVFGEEEAGRVLAIVRRGARSHYARGFRAVEELAIARPDWSGMEFNHVAYLAWHALQGRSAANVPFAECPRGAVLWEYFLDMLHHRPLAELSWPQLNEILDEVCGNWGLASLEDTRVAWTGEFEHRLDSLRSQYGHAPDEHPGKQVALPALTASLQAMGRLADQIRETPDLYHDLQQYFWAAVTGYFPSPVLVVRHHGELHFRSMGSDVADPELVHQLLFHQVAYHLMIHGRNRAGLACIEDSVFSRLTDPDGYGFRFRLA